jgi:hypothetical protein
VTTSSARGRATRRSERNYLAGSRVRLADGTIRPPKHGFLSYSQFMLGHVHSRRLRRGLVIALILVLAGVVINLLFSATPAVPVALLLAAAALFALVLLLMRGRVAALRSNSDTRKRGLPRCISACCSFDTVCFAIDSRMRSYAMRCTRSPSFTTRKRWSSSSPRRTRSVRSRTASGDEPDWAGCCASRRSSSRPRQNAPTKEVVDIESLA